jgi:hypothetical protein
MASTNGIQAFGFMRVLQPAGRGTRALAYAVNVGRTGGALYDAPAKDSAKRSD